MDEKCICCQKKEITQQKRMLCNNCYHWLHKNNRLDEFPPIAKLHDNTWWKNKYSDEFINDLKSLIDEHHVTLIQIGEKYGVTRERIRQIFELLYGFKYTVAVKAKSEIKKREKYDDRIAKRDPRYKVENYKKGFNQHKGAESEKKVFDICAALNYEIKPSDSLSVDLIINGYKAEIKSAHRAGITSPGAKTPCYHFQLQKSQYLVDFIICHAVPINKFFIIPRCEYPVGGHLYLPSIKTREWKTGRGGNAKQVRVSKYYDYLEAWSLLAPKQSETIFNKPQLAVVQ